jgi:hypothetical protein
MPEVDSNTFTMGLGNPMPESTLPHARADFIPQSGTLDLAFDTGWIWLEVCMAEKVAFSEWERVVVSKRAWRERSRPRLPFHQFM